MRLLRKLEGTSSREKKAWACLAANALVLPGIGSLAGRRFKTGALQAAGALTGMALILYWLVPPVRDAMAFATTPKAAALRHNLLYGAAGLLLLGAAWISGIRAGYRLVRHARRQDRIW